MNLSPKQSIKFLILVVVFLLTTLSFGKTEIQDKYLNVSDNSIFGGDYINYELSKNTTLIHSQNRFSGHYVTYVLGYRHPINSKWIMGLHFNFKSMLEKEGLRPGGRERTFSS